MVVSLFIACWASPPALPPIPDCAGGDTAACAKVIDHHAQQLAARFVIEGERPPAWQWGEVQTALVQYVSLQAGPEHRSRIPCNRPAPACPFKDWQHLVDFADLTAETMLFGRGIERSYTVEARAEGKARAIEEGKLARIPVQDADGRPRPWASVYVYPIDPVDPYDHKAGFAHADLDGTVLAPVDGQGRARILANGAPGSAEPQTGPYTLPFVPRFVLPPIDGPVAGRWAHDGREVDLDALLAGGKAARLSDRVVVVGDRSPSMYVYVDADTLVSIRDERKMERYSRASAATN